MHPAISFLASLALAVLLCVGGLSLLSSEVYWVRVAGVICLLCLVGFVLLLDRSAGPTPAVIKLTEARSDEHALYLGADRL